MPLVSIADIYSKNNRDTCHQRFTPILARLSTPQNTRLNLCDPASPLRLMPCKDSRMMRQSDRSGQCPIGGHRCPQPHRSRRMRPRVETVLNQRIRVSSHSLRRIRTVLDERRSRPENMRAAEEHPHIFLPFITSYPQSASDAKSIGR